MTVTSARVPLLTIGSVSLNSKRAALLPAMAGLVTKVKEWEAAKSSLWKFANPVPLSKVSSTRTLAEVAFSTCTALAVTTSSNSFFSQEVDITPIKIRDKNGSNLLDINGLVIKCGFLKNVCVEMIGWIIIYCLNEFFEKDE